MKDVGSFWARRRAAVEAEAQAEALAELDHQAEAREAALADRDDTDILEELGLPDPEGMQAGDDFTAFMARDVPEHLRRKALRTLWRSNPVLACVDGLNDYDEDYRAAMLLQEPIKTAYQVGKGMLKHIEEMERQANAVNAPQDDELLADAPDADCAFSEETEANAVISEASDTASACGEGCEEALEAPAPRRMRFRFEGATA